MNAEHEHHVQFASHHDKMLHEHDSDIKLLKSRLALVEKVIAYVLMAIGIWVIGKFTGVVDAVQAAISFQ